MQEVPAPGPAEARLDELCRAAEEKAGALGHRLGRWSAPEDVARRAVCVACGRAVYVRAEGELSGMAGRACSERCDA